MWIDRLTYLLDENISENMKRFILISDVAFFQYPVLLMLLRLH